MADNKDKIPFGGRDWNKDGKYDNFDRMTDFYVYKKVTEDWEKNGAWDKQKKPQNQYPDVEKTKEDETLENFIAIVTLIVLIIVVISAISWAASEGLLSGLILLVLIFIGLYIIL